MKVNYVYVCLIYLFLIVEIDLFVKKVKCVVVVENNVIG